MYYKIEPAQLTIYLKFAIDYANEKNFNLPKAEKLCEELTKLDWKNVKELIIAEKPF